MDMKNVDVYFIMKMTKRAIENNLQFRQYSLFRYICISRPSFRIVFFILVCSFVCCSFSLPLLISIVNEFFESQILKLFVLVILSRNDGEQQERSIVKILRNQ